MRIGRLAIQNFRGIERLVWHPRDGISCLIGAGNSGKSTIVDALTLLLATTRNISLSDADFYKCEAGSELEIAAVITGLPESLTNFDRYGDHLCGWRDGELLNDPEEDGEVALQVVFRADASLRPTWELQKPGNPDATRPFSQGEREILAVFRVEERPDFHLRWARGSALAVMTDQPLAVSQTLSASHRSARRTAFQAAIPDIPDVLDEVKQAAANFGAGTFADLKHGLDPADVPPPRALVLHDGDVPLSSDGLGSRRLTSLAIQKLSSADTSVLLIDEIELGLEPHRLLRLVRLLQDEAAAGTQVILSTHSPIVVEAITATELVVIRRVDGATRALPVPAQLEGMKTDEVQGTVRSGAPAMLANRVLVVEGATEEGFVRGCCRHWDTPDQNLGVLGVAVRNGGSDLQALERSSCLAELGYEAGAMIDSDQPLTDEAAAAAGRGVTVLRAAAGLAFEQHLFRDLPIDMFKGLLDLAVSLRPEGRNSPASVASVYDGLRANLSTGTPSEGDDPSAWIAAGADPAAVREALGNASKKGKWFKSNPGGEALAGLIAPRLDDLVTEANADASFRKHIESVRAFLYGTV